LNLIACGIPGGGAQFTRPAGGPELRRKMASRAATRTRERLCRRECAHACPAYMLGARLVKTFSERKRSKYQLRPEPGDPGPAGMRAWRMRQTGQRRRHTAPRLRTSALRRWRYTRRALRHPDGLRRCQPPSPWRESSCLLLHGESHPVRHSVHMLVHQRRAGVPPSGFAAAPTVGADPCRPLFTKLSSGRVLLCPAAWRNTP
jgi:hypothetical protein